MYCIDSQAIYGEVKSADATISSFSNSQSDGGTILYSESYILSLTSCLWAVECSLGYIFHSLLTDDPLSN